MIRLSIETGDVRREFTRIQREISDFRPLWQIVRSEFLVQNILEIFASDGRGTWPRTERPNPILRDTLRLFRSYTIPGAPGNINVETPTRLSYGSSVPYAQYHEYADRNPRIKQRQVLGLLTDDASSRELQEIVQRWVRTIINRG